MQRNNVRSRFYAWLLACFLLALPSASFAQDSTSVQPSALFGYFSHETVLSEMKELMEVDNQIKTLRAQYEQEMKRVEEEFNVKYESFLENQRSLAPSIYKKRQAELTDLMERNIAFKAEAQQHIEKARADALVPLKKKIADVVAAIAKKKGYAFVINSDNNTLTYVDPTLGDDITAEVIAGLK